MLKITAIGNLTNDVTLKTNEATGKPYAILRIASDRRYKDIDELRKLRKHHPELWEKLLELDHRALAQFGTGPLGQFKQNWSVERLDARFAEEDGKTG